MWTWPQQNHLFIAWNRGYDVEFYWHVLKILYGIPMCKVSLHGLKGQHRWRCPILDVLGLSFLKKLWDLILQCQSQLWWWSQSCPTPHAVVEVYGKKALKPECSCWWWASEYWISLKYRIYISSKSFFFSLKKLLEMMNSSFLKVELMNLGIFSPWKVRNTMGCFSNLKEIVLWWTGKCVINYGKQIILQIVTFALRHGRKCFLPHNTTDKDSWLINSGLVTFSCPSEIPNVKLPDQAEFG